MSDEIYSIIRRMIDFCTVNFQNQNTDKVQINADDGTYGGIEKVEPYGIRSKIPPETRGVRISPFGELKDSLFFGVLTSLLNLTPLADNELEVYLPSRQKIKFNADGSITISPHADNPVVNIQGSLTATGNITDATSSMQQMRDIYNSHTHTGDSGGSTSTTSQSM